MPDDLTARARQITSAELTARARKRADELLAYGDEHLGGDPDVSLGVGCIRALADRVDEQERRIKELEWLLSQSLRFPPHVTTDADKLRYLRIIAHTPPAEELERIEVKPAEALSQKGGE